MEDHLNSFWKDRKEEKEGGDAGRKGRGRGRSLQGTQPRLWDFILFYFVSFYLLLRAASTTYGGSQPRGRIGATAAGLHHSHNAGSEPSLLLIP